MKSVFLSLIFIFFALAPAWAASNCEALLLSDGVQVFESQISEFTARRIVNEAERASATRLVGEIANYYTDLLSEKNIYVIFQDGHPHQQPVEVLLDLGFSPLSLKAIKNEIERITNSIIPQLDAPPGKEFYVASMDIRWSASGENNIADTQLPHVKQGYYSFSVNLMGEPLAVLQEGQEYRFEQNKMYLMTGMTAAKDKLVSSVTVGWNPLPNGPRAYIGFYLDVL